MRVCISEGNINGAIAAVDDNVEVPNGLVQLADAPDARRANPSDHEHYAAALRPQRIGALLLRRGPIDTSPHFFHRFGPRSLHDVASRSGLGLFLA